MKENKDKRLRRKKLSFWKEKGKKDEKKHYTERKVDQVEKKEEMSK